MNPRNQAGPLPGSRLHPAFRGAHGFLHLRGGERLLGGATKASPRARSIVAEFQCRISATRKPDA